jgi:Protein of unknown function (DUF2752)
MLLGYLKKAPIELLFFTTALVCLFFLDTNKPHFSLCPLAAAGFDFCPGCGLGRSIYHLMHLEFRQSWKIHPLGFFALVVITYRIYTLTKKQIKLFKPLKP